MYRQLALFIERMDIIMFKRVSAFFAVLVISAVSCVSAFAANGNSPQGEKTHEITISSNRDDFEQKFSYVKSGDTYTITAQKDTDDYKFSRWEIIGDYELVSGSLTSRKIVVRALGDIEIKQIFKDLTANNEKPEKPGKPNKSDKSPKTGSNVAICLGMLCAAAAAASVIANKKAK